MTLYQPLRFDTGVALQVVDVLAVISQKLAFVLQQAKELVGG